MPASLHFLDPHEAIAFLKPRNASETQQSETSNMKKASVSIDLCNNSPFKYRLKADTYILNRFDAKYVDT